MGCEGESVGMEIGDQSGVLSVDDIRKIHNGMEYGGTVGHEHTRRAGRRGVDDGPRRQDIGRRGRRRDGEVHALRGLHGLAHTVRGRRVHPCHG